MAVDIKALKAHGIHSGAYKRIFTADQEVRPKRINKLIDLVASRVRDGRDQRLSDYRIYWALDLACEEPINNIKPTLLRDFLTHKWDGPEDMVRGLENFGLLESDLFIDAKLPNGQTGKIINPPVLFKTIVPIVSSYVKIRLSKIFNERNTSPLLPFNPIKMTPTDEVICEVVTDFVDTISRNYGYSSTMHDAFFNALKYGTMLMFPREEWHIERQIEGTEPNEKIVTVKEGIRYVVPHPTRQFADMMFPLHTFNSDTGCEWGGFWNIVRYGDILDNRNYWNRQSISYGTTWFDQPLAQNYFQEVYPCQISFPTPTAGASNKREDRASYYSTGDRDKSLFVAEMFMKIIPRDWGLGEYTDGTFKKLSKTYEYPVWHRFTLAGDDTIIWCSPCAYNPMLFCGYDYDANSARNSSLALECLQAQDQVSNLVTQSYITAKQNLTNCIFYDTNMIDKGDIEQINYKGDQKILSLNFIGYDSTKISRSGTGPQNAFHPVQLQQKDIQQIQQMINSVLNLLERTLQITAQESGGSASHQQSKEEIIQTGGASSNRLQYTASFFDQFLDAWKLQIYTAYRAYGDAEINAQVSSDIPNVEETLEKIGFKVKDKGEEKHQVTGRKHTLRLEDFARANEGPQVAENKEQSQIIFQTMGTIAGQPDLRAGIGVKNILQIIEWAAILGGAPRGFRLRISPNTKQDEIPEAIKNAIMEAQKATLQAVETKIAQPIAQEMAGDKQSLAQLTQLVTQLQGIYKVAEANQEKTNIKKAESQQKMQQRDAEFKADQARKDQALKADIDRRFQELHTKLQVMVGEATAKMHSKKVEAAAKIGAAKTVADAKTSEQ